MTATKKTNRPRGGRKGPKMESERNLDTDDATRGLASARAAAPDGVLTEVIRELLQEHRRLLHEIVHNGVARAPAEDLGIPSVLIAHYRKIRRSLALPEPTLSEIKRTSPEDGTAA